jgi:site-specific recombinase XerD
LLIRKEVRMSNAPISDDGWLSRLTEHLQKERYHRHIVARWTAVAHHFLVYLGERGTRVEDAQPSDVAGYLRQERRRYVRRHHHRSPSISGWQNSHTGGIHMLLRLVQGSWPPPTRSLTAHDQFRVTVAEEYAAWMQDRRGLATETCSDRCEEVRRFLGWLGPRGTVVHLRQLEVADLDAYVTSRAASLRRVTVKGVTVKLRSFLRFLHATGRTTRDLSVTIVGPRVYADEAIPSALQVDDVTRVLEATRRDRSAIGRRDYAILMLLAKYGLRAGEVTALRLDDLDWRRDRLRIHHAKTGAFSELPLLVDVGDAIVQYLRHGRPQVTYREVFIRNRAPYRPFQSGSSLYTPVRDRLDRAGITPAGKRGPHAFRHARAVTLLRAAVPAKHIGDILGHRSAESTAVYLKLATEDLRGVSLEVPTEVTA